MAADLEEATYPPASNIQQYADEGRTNVRVSFNRRDVVSSANAAKTNFHRPNWLVTERCNGVESSSCIPCNEAADNADGCFVQKTDHDNWWNLVGDTASDMKYAMITISMKCQAEGNVFVQVEYDQFNGNIEFYWNANRVGELQATQAGSRGNWGCSNCPGTPEGMDEFKIVYKRPDDNAAPTGWLSAAVTMPMSFAACEDNVRHLVFCLGLALTVHSPCFAEGVSGRVWLG